MVDVENIDIDLVDDPVGPKFRNKSIHAQAYQKEESYDCPPLGISGISCDNDQILDNIDNGKWKNKHDKSIVNETFNEETGTKSPALLSSSPYNEKSE